MGNEIRYYNGWESSQNVIEILVSKNLAEFSLNFLAKVSNYLADFSQIFWLCIA